MRCDYANAPAGSILSLLPDASSAAAACAVIKAAAAFYGVQDSWCICARAKKITGYDRKRGIRYVRYLAACPLLDIVINRAANVKIDHIEKNGVYTVAIAARWLDMSPAAVRRLVRSGVIAGVADRGGFLIPGGSLLAFASGGVAVINAGRMGGLRSGK